MSAPRLMILGVVRILQPVHGYDVRRELLRWHADDWASVAPGSVYHALSLLERDRLIEIVDAERIGRRPARTRYRMTEKGESEFHSLLHDMWWRPKAPVDPFTVALTFLPCMPRDNLVAALRNRAQWARSSAETAKRAAAATTSEDMQHCYEIYGIVRARAEGEAKWAEDLADRLERGEGPSLALDGLDG